MDYNIRGTLDTLPMIIYVNDNYMANIIYLKEVADYFCVTMDSREDHAILFHYIDKKAYRFKECGRVLYYLDVYNPEIITLKTERGDTDYYYLYNVNANMDYYTCADIE